MEMNQELLGCDGGFVGDCKTSSFNGGIVNPLPSVLPRSPSSSSYSIKASHSEKQNLSCPRCKSSNTKFCYYNNYNLTQPRHFCKTCRRYWTKGGALRNIPIGGGCRKNKTSVMPTGVGKSSSAKTKMFLSEIGGNVFHQQYALNSILCDSSHHLGFLRALQNPNLAASSAGDSSSPNNDATMIGGLEVMTAAVARSSGFDSSKKSSTMALSSSVWRESNQTMSSGTQEFHQKLRFSSENIFADHPSVFLSNMPFSSVISTPVAGGDLSRLNPAFSCSDLPATSGAYI